MLGMVALVGLSRDDLTTAVGGNATLRLAVAMNCQASKHAHRLHLYTLK